MRSAPVRRRQPVRLPGRTWPRSAGITCAAGTLGTSSTTRTCSCGSGSSSRRSAGGWRWKTTATATSGPGGGRPAPDAVVTGSHLDSVPGGGAFDGPLGRGVGACWPSTSCGCAGVAAGPAVGRRLLRRGGGRPVRPALHGISADDRCRRRRPGAATARSGRGVGRRRRPAGRVRPVDDGPGPGAARPRIGTFVELHVEQGRLLQTADAAAVVGVGSEILAHGRWRITVTGQGNHAGTTRPADRKDPMIPAAAAVFAARRAIIRARRRGRHRRPDPPDPRAAPTSSPPPSQLWLDVAARIGRRRPRRSSMRSSRRCGTRRPRRAAR